MKRTGIIIFGAALLIGLVVSNIFSFGRTACDLFHFSVNFDEKGSGKIATEKRNISGFKGVEVGGAYWVEITAGRDFSVEVEADDNLLPLIKTDVDDGVLEIESERRIKPTHTIRVRITAPDIDKLDVSGAANLMLTDVKNSSLSVEASGASKIKISGETAKFNLESSGASQVDADNLKTVNTNVDSSGASHIEVNVSGDLSVEASGASTILYSGKPSVHQKTTGASNVSAK